MKEAYCLAGASVGENSVIRNSVICAGNAKIREGVSVCDGAAIGDGCTVGSGCVIGAVVKIAPDNVIPKNTVLDNERFGRDTGRTNSKKAWLTR